MYGRFMGLAMGVAMLKTISIGSCVSVQGLVVGQQADGRIVVRVDEKTFVGFPVSGR